jgi:energy-coupling factor transporter ATP-binding protein EcfA2
VFADAFFEFVPGVNAFIGENGSGKTHLLKAMYAYQRPPSRDVPDFTTTILRLFQIEKISDVRRSQAGSDAFTDVSGTYGDHRWAYPLEKKADDPTPLQITKIKMGTPVFIPAIDMMGHTQGFLEAYLNVDLDFDLTCRDIVSQFGLRSRNVVAPPEIVLAELLGGELEQDERGRFYLQTPIGRQPMPMVAEGLRKIAALVWLQRNGWIAPGATLFWDEPEVNLNPNIMDDVVRALLGLARSGVQVFIATHSYLMLRELEVQSEKSDAIRYFALSREATGTTVHPAGSYLDLTPNTIEHQYADLYDRGIAKRLRGE